MSEGGENRLFDGLFPLKVSTANGRIVLVESWLRHGEIIPDGIVKFSAGAESEMKFAFSASAEFHCEAISLCGAEFHILKRQISLKHPNRVKSE